MKLGALPVTLRQLQYICAVAQTLNFRKAAQLCHVSQPSLSAQVKELESMLEIQIFERSRRGVLITQAGEPLLEQARHILASTEQLLEIARRHTSLLEGTLRLGVIPTIAPYLMPAWDMALRQHFPSLQLRWREDKTDVLLEKMRAGELDAALLAHLPSLGPVEFAPLLEDPFVLAASQKHALGGDDSAISVKALQEHSLLLLEDGHCFRDQALDLCATAGAQASRFQASSLSTLVQMVVGHGGLTILPQIAVEAEGHRSGLVLRAFSDPPPCRTLILAWRPDDPRGAAFRRLAQVLDQAPK